MNDSTREFLLWLGIPDKMTGFELLGETLEQSMEYVRKGRKINQTDIFISLAAWAIIQLYRPSDTQGRGFCGLSHG